MKYTYLNNDKFEVLSGEDFVNFDKLRFHYTDKLLKFKFKNIDDTITVTENHKFFSDDTKENTKLASEYKVGDWMPHNEFYYVCIDSIEEINEKRKVYDLIDVENHLYNTNNFYSHNCSFIGSSKTLIPGENLLELNESIKEPIETKYGGLMLIYEQPIEGAKYVLGNDPAEGLGKDYSTTQVFRLLDASDNEEGKHLRMKQVAVFRDNEIRPQKYAQAIISIAQYFNSAWVMIENNSIGNLVCHHVWFDYEYEFMYNPDKARKGKLGINANKKSKFTANMKLVDMITNYRIEIVDKITVQELNSYEEVSPQCYAAGNSAVHDDTITSMLWAITFLDTKFYDGYDEDAPGKKGIDEEFIITPPAFRNASKKSKPTDGFENLNPYLNVGRINRRRR
jgi:hypothetical protein